MLQKRVAVVVLVKRMRIPQSSNCLECKHINVAPLKTHTHSARFHLPSSMKMKSTYRYQLPSATEQTDLDVHMEHSKNSMISMIRLRFSKWRGQKGGVGST